MFYSHKRSFPFRAFVLSDVLFENTVEIDVHKHTFNYSAVDGEGFQP